MKSEQPRPSRVIAWVDGLWRCRWILVLLVVAITGIALYEAKNIRVDNSHTAWFEDNPEMLADYQAFLDSFGSDDQVAVALHRKQTFASVEGTELLRGAVSSIEAMPGVGQVFSFLTLTDAVEKSPLVLPMFKLSHLLNVNERQSLLLSDALIAKRFLSADGLHALIIIRLNRVADIEAARDHFTEELKLALAPFNTEYSVAGMSVIYGELNKLSRSEASRLSAIAVAVMGVLLFWAVRQGMPVLVSLVAALLAAIWMFGFVGYSGKTMNVLTSIVPTAILAIGISISVHLFSHLGSVEAGLPVRDRLVKGLAFILPPCAVAAATTMAGFGSLMSAGLGMTRDLGLLLVIGVGAVFVLVVLFAVVAARFQVQAVVSADSFTKLANWLVGFGLRRPCQTMAGFTLIAVIAIAGTTRINIDAFPLELLPPDHKVRADSARIESLLAPYTTLEFVVSAEDDVLQLQHLRLIDQWINRVVSKKHAAWSLSVLDIIKRNNQLRSGGYPSITPELPPDKKELTYILNSINPGANQDLSMWMSGSEHLRVIFTVPIQPASQLKTNLEEILKLAPGGQLQVAPAGLMPLWIEQIGLIVESQLRSFAIAFILILGIIIAVLRRADLVVLAVVVNLLPVITTTGVMGLFGIRLDLATVAVASVILGLVVDDTIHFLYRLKIELRGELDIAQAVQSVANSSGRAIVISSVVLGFGFGVLAFAQVTSIIWFGLLIGVAVLSALLADLVLAPALLVILNRLRPVAHK